MAVLAKTTLLFSKAGEGRDTSLNDTFSPLGGALHSSASLRGACSVSLLHPCYEVQAAR